MSKLFIGLKRDYHATLIGLSRANHALTIEVNPDLDQIVNPGDKIFYIADDRIQHFEWNEFSGEKYV